MKGVNGVERNHAYKSSLLNSSNTKMGGVRNMPITNGILKNYTSYNNGYHGGGHQIEGRKWKNEPQLSFCG